ncbi:MAG: hypothetical protein QXI60_07445 [Thermofilaceae archaeon]
MRPKIVEEDDYWVIESRVDSESYGTATVMGGVAELGVKDGRVWFRKIYYPKKLYSLEEMEAVVRRMERCELCKAGVPVEEKKLISEPKQDSYRIGMVELVTLGGVVGGAIGGKIVSEAIDKYVAPKTGEDKANAFKLVLGILALLAIYGIRMSKTTEDILLGFGAYMTTAVVDLFEKWLGISLATERVALVPVQPSYAPVAPQAYVAPSVFG